MEILKAVGLVLVYLVVVIPLILVYYAIVIIVAFLCKVLDEVIG